MRVYIAGKLCTDSERKSLEEIAEICESLGFDTFLPHRDVGLARGIKNIKEIFKGDIIKGLKDVGLVVALLDGLHVGAGTAWELGYAYAKNIPAIGIKTDESIEQALDYLSSILIASMEIVDSLEKFKSKLEKFKSNQKV